MPIQMRAGVEALIASRLADNTAGGITAEDLRDVLAAIVESAYWQGEGVGPAGKDGRNAVGTKEITSASYTLTAADKQFILECNRSFDDVAEIVIALPSDAQADFAVGDAVHIMQSGSAPVRVAAGGGITLVLPPDFRPVTAAQGYGVTVYKVGPNRWRLCGNPEPQAEYFSHFRRVTQNAIGPFGVGHVRTWSEITALNATTVTLPTDEAAPNVYVGADAYFVQAGAGVLTIAAADGVTLVVPAGKQAQTAGPDSVVHVVKVGDNKWRVRGDLADAA